MPTQINQMLELYDKGFNAVILKILLEAFTNILETNKQKIENLSKDLEVIKRSKCK